MTSFNKDSGPVYFPKPSIIIYRFLYVIKSRNQLALEVVKFVEQKLSRFLQQHWDEPEIVDLIKELRIESITDGTMNNSDDNDAPIIFAETQPVVAIQDSVILYVVWKCHKANKVLDVGRKTVALKRLIHLVVLEGILMGEFRIHIEQDHVDALKYCLQNQIKQYILSSCLRPVFGTNRLLSFTDQGDLTKYFTQFLDEKYSTKTKETYVDLAQKFGLPPSSILLVAFSKTECKKAARAGYMVAKIREFNQQKPKYYTMRIISDIGTLRFAESVFGPTTSVKSAAVNTNTTTRNRQTMAPFPQNKSSKRTRITNRKKVQN